LPEDVRAQNAIENILGKYDGKPESMASAIYGLRQKQTATAEERNKFESLLNDNFEKSADGEFVLRADAAAKRLGQERGNGSSRAPIQVPPVEAVLKAVEQEAREVLATQYESEQVEEILKVQAPRLKAEAESKIEFFKGEISKRENERKVVAGNIIRDHLSKHPEHKDVMPQVAELLGGLPNDEARTEAIIGNWFGGIGRLAG
ncbi:MAG: hypothetical protein GY725_00805, partial [bacterium]|nr:hypothetical protein [bacterium]